MASHLLDGYLLLREKQALLEPMLFDRKVVASRGSGRSKREFNTLKHTLFLGCIQDVANLCADKDQRAPSIANIAKTLLDTKIRNELRDKFSSWVIPFAGGEADAFTAEQLRKIESREQMDRRIRFDQLYTEFLQCSGNLGTSPLLHAFRDVRDKVSAHTEIRPLGDRYAPLDISTLGIHWGDIGRIISEMQRPVALSGLLVRNASFAWDALDTLLRISSTDFWQDG